MKSEDQVFMIMGAGALVLLVIGAVCLTVYAIHKNRVEAELKRELLDRGMSAEEVATVISAKADRGGQRRSIRL